MFSPFRQLAPLAAVVRGLLSTMEGTESKADTFDQSVVLDGTAPRLRIGSQKDIDDC